MHNYRYRHRFFHADLADSADFFFFTTEPTELSEVFFCLFRFFRS